ncbi:RagB/SusD family nutrient uptake outer membrane protein [Membranihabitans maritimus]|uniref:RagB/SusD family nutrient uptake outer membrane protein n=1 Tax=Membranihabitans maritimus TaxID=2904244 RepID=UPI001F466F17|nr:RagB/SusD family nutrient uptake outer membrane protein [Membranihabitans maritimus]
MKTKYLVISSIIVLSFFSCKDFLETKPTDFLSPANYYETAEHLDFARASVYDILTSSPVYGVYGQYLLAWEADIGYMNRSTLTTGPWNYNFSSADPYSSNFWTYLYRGINRANVVLANLDKNLEISQEFRDRVRGEVLFLRGYFYFLLVQTYGGVPLLIEPTASVDDVNVPRNTIREIYDQILSDMETSEPLVEGITELGFGGAVNKSAVRGILARVNLAMAGYPLQDESRYEEARNWAKMVIDDQVAQHEINSSFPDIFIKLASDQYDIKESIWEGELYGNGLDEYNETGYIGWINGPIGYAGSGTGRMVYYMNITAKFYNSFEEGDARKWWSVALFRYANTDVNGEKWFDFDRLPTTEAAKYNLKPAKWRREYEAVLPKSETRTPMNMPILRFTDVLLMYAEAENAINGPSQEIIDIVNSIRQRGWSDGVKEIELTNGGSGYTEAPEVVFSEETGNGASATAIIDTTTGQVVDIVMDRDLDAITYYEEGHYTAPPVISLEGGGGSGASAIATIHYKEDANLNTGEITTKENFLKVIQEERMREFSFESLRKFDLLRWGKFLEVHQEMADDIAQDAPGAWYIINYSNVSEKSLLWPIPSNEMTVNQAMEQNPGW